MTDTDKISQDEMVKMFGETMPIEAVNLIWDSPGTMTVGEVRAELRKLAARPKTAQEKAELAFQAARKSSPWYPHEIFSILEKAGLQIIENGQCGDIPGRQKQ